ncbi:MAG: hypothetical protein ABR591_03805, partial [Candidatus Velthaea sp.]
MLKKLAPALAALALVGAPLAALAQPQYPQYPQGPSQSIGTTVVPSQSVLTGTLEGGLDSKTAQTGDQVVLDLHPPFPNDDPRFNGGRIFGHVASVTHASNTKKGGIDLAFDRLELSDGTVASIAGQMTSIQSTANGNTAGRAIVGGIVGQIVGNYIGKHIGSDVGGAVGAIGGAIYAGNLGTNISVPQGSTVQLKTTQN